LVKYVVVLSFSVLVLLPASPIWGGVPHATYCRQYTDEHPDNTYRQRKGASHRGRRCHLQVHGLKDEAHLRGHLDDLAAHQAQLLVVVEYRVHVLNPHGVHRAVEDQPFPVGALREWKK